MSAVTAVVTVKCPDCDGDLPVEVWAEMAGRADDGILQVTVLGDMIEVKAHSLTCRGTAE